MLLLRSLFKRGVPSKVGLAKLILVQENKKKKIKVPSPSPNSSSCRSSSLSKSLSSLKNSRRPCTSACCFAEVLGSVGAHNRKWLPLPFKRSPSASQQPPPSSLLPVSSPFFSDPPLLLSLNQGPLLLRLWWQQPGLLACAQQPYLVAHKMRVQNTGPSPFSHSPACLSASWLVTAESPLQWVTMGWEMAHVLGGSLRGNATNRGNATCLGG